MTRIMVGVLLYLMASAAPLSSPAPPAAQRTAAVRPVRASAQATATIRIVSGVRFGPGYSAEVAGAARRSTQIDHADGTKAPAELLEFQ